MQFYPRYYLMLLYSIIKGDDKILFLKKLFHLFIFFLERKCCIYCDVVTLQYNKD